MSLHQSSRVSDWIRISAGNHPSRTCFVTGSGGVTFAEVNERVNRLASALGRLGVAKGDRVALFATDSVRYLEILLACMKLGAVYVPLNFRLAGPELQTLLRVAEPAVLFFSDRYSALVGDVERSWPCVTVGVDSRCGDESYEDLVAAGEDVEADVPVTDDELVGLAFTSGTTARPKAVMHSQRMVRFLVTQCILERRMTDLSFHYTAAPLFHVGGMYYALTGVARGHTSLVLPAFDAPTVARWMAHGGLDGVFLVPTMINMLLREPAVADPDSDFSHVRSIAYGAAPMSPSLLRRAMDRFDCDFVNLFGGTEGGLQTVLTPEDHRRALDGDEHLLGSIGKPGVGVRLRLCEPELATELVDVADGAVGEMVTRSESAMTGYLDQPAETAEAFVDGWFRGGDLAWRDKEGYLYLSGRRRDMIIRGGENIYPAEIEDVLGRYPGVREVAVVGVPDDHWGEIVRAHVVLEPGHSLDEHAARDWCRARLAGYKVPAVLAVETDLPRNPSGKVLKRELRRLGS